MTALEALRKIENERQRVEIHQHDFRHVEADEDGNPIAIDVCGSDLGFDDEFQIIEDELKRNEPMETTIEENYHCFTCPKCDTTWDYVDSPEGNNYCATCGQRLILKREEEEDEEE